MKMASEELSVIAEHVEPLRISNFHYKGMINTGKVVKNNKTRSLAFVDVINNLVMRIILRSDKSTHYRPIQEMDKPVWPMVLASCQPFLNGSSFYD